MITQPTIENLSRFIEQKRGQISPRDFADEFGKIKKHYLASRQRDTFCSEADSLASKMIEEKNIDFAGIILSSLCKLTQYFPEQLEYFALKGLQVARLNKDPVHIMARLNDLRKIYYRRPDKLYEYLQVLYQQEKCLKTLTQNYEHSKDAFQTLSRRIAPKRDYDLMLAHVQTEIGKITKRKKPFNAQTMLISARATFEARGYKQNVEYIDMLLNEIKDGFIS